MRPASCVGVVLVTCCVVAVAQSSVAFAKRQAPKPLAQHSFDVNGDGKLDTIGLVAPAALSIVFAGKATPAVWKPLATAGRVLGGNISATTVAGAAVIVVTIELRVGNKRVSEAVALRYFRGRTTTVVSESVGPQGEDGEWSKHLVAANGRLVRHQGAPRVRRCDGKTAQLFPEVYDWRRRRFVTTHPAVDVTANAPILSPTLVAPPGVDATVRPIAFQTNAASADGSATSADDLNAPRELEDGKLGTAWLAHNSAGGIGEFVTYRSTMTIAAVRGLRVVPAQTRRMGNHVTSLAIVIGNNAAYRVKIPSSTPRQQPYWIVFPKPIAGTCVTVIVEGVARSRGGKTAFAEMFVLTDLELTPGGPDAALAAYVAGGGARARHAMRALRRRGGAASAPLIKAIATRTKSIEKLRLRRALATIGAANAATELVHALRMPALNKHDYQTFGRALARIGHAAIKPLESFLSRATGSVTARKAAVGALTKIRHGDAATALSLLLGTGKRSWRAYLSKHIGAARPLSELQRWLGVAVAAHKAGQAKREADAWQVLRRLRARDAKAVSAKIDDAMQKRLETSASLSATAGYELRYRLFSIAAGSANATVLAQLQKSLAALHSTHVTSPALRRVVINAMARNPAAGVKQILVGLAGNSDPGVRRNVALAFGGRSDADAATDRALSSHIRTDKWPQVRTAAASAFSLRCKQPAVAAVLYHAVDMDKQVSVQRVAISSLVRCRAPGILPRLYKLASNKKRHLELRIHAVGEIATLGDRTRINQLINMFKQHRREAWAKTGALQLASASAVALGRLGGNLAIGPLMRAARDDAFPEIQAAAVTGLSHVCPRSARRVFDKLVGSGQRQVSLAARTARQKCFGRR